MKYIIVGGVAGGATTAARIRRADEFAEIIIFEKGWRWLVIYIEWNIFLYASRII